jgi:tryptophan-rich sensory protein
MRKKPQWIGLGLFILLAAVAAAIGGAATASSVKTWYPTLAKPSWTPPSALFAPVWTALYVMMSVAVWRVWAFAPSADRRVFRAYCAQLALNATWSVLFFGLRSPGLAMADIVVMWVFLVWLQVQFWRLDRWAGLLWAPYVLWVSFALALNFAICTANAGK